MSKKVSILVAATSLCLSSLAAFAQTANTQAPTSAYDQYSKQTSYAEYMRTTYGLQHGYNSIQLQAAIQGQRAKELEQQYGLKPGWKATEYCRSYAIGEASYRRTRNNLTPNYTDVDYFRALAATVFDNRVPAEPNFTEQQLRDKAAAGVDYGSTYDTGWKDDHGSFNAADYKAAAGSHESAHIAKEWKLHEDWTYHELELSAGPQEAALKAMRFGFKRWSTHAEIVALIGEKQLEEYTSFTKLPKNFTAADYKAYRGQRAVSAWQEEFNDKSGPVDSAWILRHSLAREMQNFHYAHPSMGEHGTETDLIADMAADKCKYATETYGLPYDFDEKSYTEAQALSEIAALRKEKDLGPYFDEDDLIRAEQSKTNYFREFYYYSR